MKLVFNRRGLSTPTRTHVYVKAIRELKESGELPQECEHRPTKYLNNIVKQDHRFSRHRVKVSQHLRNFWSAQRTIGCYETINMIRKGQIEGVACGDALGQKDIIHGFFGVAV